MDDITGGYYALYREAGCCCVWDNKETDMKQEAIVPGNKAHSQHLYAKIPTGYLMFHLNINFSSLKPNRLCSAL